MSASNSIVKHIDEPIFVIKKLGRRPIPEEKRRVQFGTRIERLTLACLTKYAEDHKVALGRALDDIIQRTCPLD